MKQDIKNEEDIKQLVDAFYDKVKQDDVIGYIFQNIIGEDWSHHLPIMYRFWTTVLLAKPGYMGNPIARHIDVDKKEPLKEEHYERWLQLWEETINEMYEGAVADEAKKRAKLMMQLISAKVSWARKGNFIQ